MKVNAASTPSPEGLSFMEMRHAVNVSSEMHPYVVTYARTDILPAHSCC